MIFTQEQIDEIEQKLAKRGAKDTQLPSAKTPLTGDESIAIVQERENRLVPVGSIVNTDGGIFNVSEYLKVKTEVDTSVILTLSEAVEACPSRAKKAGQIITFIDKDKEWQRYQYQGYNAENWNQLTLWKDLNNVSEDIPVSEDAMVFNITEYMPGGSKATQAIWAGIYTIDGITPVSQYRVIFGCDTSLGIVEGVDMDASDTLAIIDMDTDEVAVFSYILFVGNSIDGYRYQTTINSDEDVPDWIAKAFGNNSSYIAANIESLERRVNTKLNNKVDKIQGKGLSTNDFTDANVSELANSIVNAVYNSNTKKLVFTKNNSGTIEIDATPFIKDGMIDEVKIENGYLVIVFNTDSGKETIRIALVDIFNPDNYYTRTQTDDLLDDKVDKEQGKGLSTNDFTTAEKNKLNDLPTNSQLQLSLEGKANKIPMPPVVHDLIVEGTTQVSDVITLITGRFEKRPDTQIFGTFKNTSIIEFSVNYTGKLRFEGIRYSAILKYIKAYVNGTLVETSTERIIDSEILSFNVEANDIVKVEFTIYNNTDYFYGCIGDLSITSAGVPKDLIDVYNSLAPVATSGSYNDLSDTPTIPDITGKADKVSNATNGNFAALDSNGNLVDSGHKHSDYLTQHQSLSNYIQKSQTAGFVKNDGTIDTNTYITQHQDISGKEDVTNIVTPVNTTDATLPITTLACEVGKYYRIDVAVDTLDVTLPAMTDLTTVRTVVICLTAGTTPAVTISSADSKDVNYQDSFEIVAGNTYEINALFNGAAWIVAAVKINVE